MLKERMKESITDITANFTKAIARVNLAFKQYMQLKFKQYNLDITFEMLQVMACLWTKDGVNQQEIANFTVKDKASMTYLIDNLAKRKFVYRQEDDSDRRNKLIFLTDEGKSLRTQIEPLVKEMYRTANKDIPVDWMMQSIGMLDQIHNNLGSN